MISFKKHQQYFKYIFGIFLLLWIGLCWWKTAAEPAAHWTPDYPKIPIMNMLAKNSLDSEEYQILFMQTGLGRSALDAMIMEKNASAVLRIQQTFFTEPKVICKKNSPVSWEEAIDNSEASSAAGCLISNLEDGDVLITPCSHTFGWRNGHAALVINAEKGQTLESVVLGQRSCIQSTNKWEKYPAFLVLRLADVSKETRDRIAEEAVLLMNDLPYGFFDDIFEHIGAERESKSTHCSHLIWKVYNKFGYNIDGDGGVIVTPKDISESPLLEVVQVYGMNPDKLW